ncbi:enolase-phosphatase E1-like isoform X1 [Lytechinus variegatus]|uniref:enolase-phosphatase E1-like isoform X1 n=2 Tax=Lytechinus variegatus TaxID=7654 RepID=UPI001BB204B7|nr:enolase-phosphatase E1-like isoform X1 [Lytechinus variegatus]
MEARQFDRLSARATGELHAYGMRITCRDSNMTEESPRKRARLCEDEVDSLCKPDLQEHIKKQDEYIAELEARLEMSAASTSNNGDGEDKLRHLKAARREQLLVMRLTTKEQELHELANQLADKNQNASTAQLRAATVDPALNLLIQRLKKELEDKTTNLQQAHEDMAAWKFTPDSQTGKRLMARCRTLIQENQELGKQVSQGKVAQVEAELALQKEINEELKNSQDEMYEMVIQLNDEGEGMQSTIVALQQELKEKKLEIARLTYAAESAGILLTPDSVADMKHEPQLEDNEEQNMQPVSPTNMQESTEGKHVEPCKELVDYEEEKKEVEEVMMEEKKEEESFDKQIPDVRTTEYIDEETPMEVMSPHDQGPVENKSLSVEPWCNPSHFVESPASPVEEDRRSAADEPVIGDADFRTEAPSQETCEPPNPAAEGEEIPKFQGGNSEAPDSNGQLLIGDSPSEQEQVESTDFRDLVKEEEAQVRTPVEESSQGSLQSEDAPEIDAVSSRTGGGSGTLTPEFSTNGDDSHSEPLLFIPQNNGKRSDHGRLGESENCDYDDDKESNTLGRDHSTFGAAIEGEFSSSLDDESDKQSEITDKQSDISDKQSDVTDKQSDITDKQSDETTIDNNNGLSNPGDGIDSNLSSPQEEQNCVSDGEFVRTTDNVINKSINSVSYSNSPDERTDLEQCEEIPSATNSNPEEISV